MRIEDKSIQNIPSSIEEPLTVILIIFVASRECHWLGTNFWLPSNPCNMGKVGSPLPALQPVLPAFTNQHALISFRIILCKNWSKMIGRDSDKDLSTTSISLPSLLCPLSGVCLVRSVLVVDKMVNLWCAHWGHRFWHLGHSYGNNKGRINTGLACNLAWDFIAAICTCALSLPNPFLKAFKAKVVTTWCLRKTK